jgi:hypothetical protein
MENFKDGGFELFLGLRREGIVKINYPNPKGLAQMVKSLESWGVLLQGLKF